MKAQRRHELKANSLIWHLQGLPETIKKYQSQIALVVILIALAIVMIRYRINAAAQRIAQAELSLSVAGDQLRQLRSHPFMPGDDPANFMKQREEFYFDALQQAEDAYEKAPDSQAAMKAEALLDKGDLNFEMANSPALPGAATQPSLRPAETDDALLSNAYDAYMQVLQNYPDQTFAATAAHFGLAAVAEDRAAKDPTQWDAAKSQYQAILDSSAGQAYKTMATMRLDLLPKLSQPVTVGFSAKPQPTSQPSSAQAVPLGPQIPTTQK